MPLRMDRWIHEKQIAVHPEEPIVVLATAQQNLLKYIDGVSESII